MSGHITVELVPGEVWPALGVAPEGHGLTHAVSVPAELVKAYRDALAAADAAALALIAYDTNSGGLKLLAGLVRLEE